MDEYTDGVILTSAAVNPSYQIVCGIQFIADIVFVKPRLADVVDFVLLAAGATGVYQVLQQCMKVLGFHGERSLPPPDQLGQIAVILAYPV